MHSNISDTNRIKYKQYEIQASPYKKEINGVPKWSTHYIIREHRGYDIPCRKITSKEIFNTKEDAIEYCFLAGKAEIDGKPI